MNNGWSIGPDIARLELRAVAGLPVVWPLLPLPDNWTPFDPEFNIFLQNDTIVSFKLVYGPLGSEEGWYIALSGAQTKTLETATYVQLVDTGVVVAAGRYTNLTGWSANISPVTMPVRVVGAPSASDAVSDHGDLDGLGDDDHDQYALSDGSRGNFAAAEHEHTLEDITDYSEPDLSNLVETTDGRLSDSRTPTAHNHPIGGVTGLQAALDGKQTSGSYAPSVHNHPISGVTGLQTALDGKQAAGEYASSSHDHVMEDITDYTAPDLSDFVSNSDERLSDARTPTAHSHSINGVIGLQTALDGKQAAGEYASKSHNHDDKYATIEQGIKADSALQIETPQPIIELTGTSHILSITHVGAIVTFTDTDAITLTVPSGIFSAGQRVDCSQRGDGAVTVVGDSVVLNPMPGMTLVSEAKFAMWTIFFHSDTEADVIGWMAGE